jgi:hypothetical protein
VTDERDLQEVERALSVLGGRHPETVRAERQAAEAAEKRRREHEAAAAANRRRAIRRQLVVVAVIGALGAGGVAAVRVATRRAAEDRRVAPLVARYVGLGFEALPRGAMAPENRAVVTTVAGDCYVLVAARGARMRIERPIGSQSAEGEALLCTCATEKITATTDGAPVRALHVAGPALGGTRAVRYRFPKGAPKVLGGDDACADDTLAAFARNGGYGQQAKDGAWLAAHPALAESGFKTVASAPSRLPFAFVPAADASTCFVAAAGADDALTLWTLDGGVQKPLQQKRGPVAWCAAKAAPFVVERTGSGAAVVVSAPSQRIGGLIGLREALGRAGLSAATYVRDDERGAISADTLRASVVPDPTAVGAQTIEAAQAKDARVLVFSTPTAETFASTEADFRCSPSLELHDALCVQARALTWHEPPPGVAAAAAYGPLPYWMTVLAESQDPRAIDAELAMIGFARRMSARGFTPGVIEGVTERKDSVEILGRSGDDAVVAVGLWPEAPFIHPYGGARPWTLDGEPHVERLAGGVRVSFPLRTRSTIPLDRRRTVVFRRSKN